MEDPALCRRKHVREEIIDQVFHEMLGRLRVDNQVKAMMRKALLDSGDAEKRERERENCRTASSRA